MLLGTMKEENFAINKSVCTQRKNITCLVSIKKISHKCVRFLWLCAARPAERLLSVQLLSKVNFSGYFLLQ